MIADPLLRRRERPRVVFFIGHAYSLEESLVADIVSLPIAAAYFWKQPPERLMEAMYGQNRRDPAYPTIITTNEGLPSWQRGRNMPLFVLGASRPRRAPMLSQLESISLDQPIYFGFALSRDEQQDVIEYIAEYDADAPFILIASPEPVASDVLSLQFFGSWGSARAGLEAQRVELLLTDEPFILVGETKVSLNQVFAEPELRIDDRIRVLTTRAIFGADDSIPLSELFESIMSPDEGRYSARAADDNREWWAIGKGLGFARDGIDEAIASVERRLQKARHETMTEASGPVIWLPCEASSGATTYLHMIALRVARKGYPTLVVKQLVDGVNAFQISTFLTELHRRANARTGALEQPSLLVIDVPHAGRETIEELPARIAGADRRQMVTLWAVRIPDGVAEPPPGAAPFRHYGEHFSGLSREPKQGDVFLPPLRSTVGERELQRLAQHVSTLRGRGLSQDLADRSLETWREFQRQSAFRVPGHDIDFSEAQGWLEAEALFWPLLYHFLRPRSQQDRFLVPNFERLFRRRLRLGNDQADGFRAHGLLLEIAKASNWGIVLPSSALVDWISRPPLELNVHSPSGASAAEAVRDDDTVTEQDIQRMLEAWRSFQSIALQDASSRPLVAVRRLIDDFEQDGLVRSIIVDGHLWVRCPHRALARALLLTAQAMLREFPQFELTVGPPASLFEKRTAFEAFRSLIQRLRFAPQNIQLLEQLSETLLHGDDDDPAWQNGGGERRLELYEMIPADLLNSSRALLHHRALVLRRSTFWKEVPAQTKLIRLRGAARDIEKSLALPWQLGTRSEHPAHLLTTLAYIKGSLMPLEATTSRASLRSEIRGHFESALLELPNSRQTRWGLADLLRDEALAEKAAGRREAAVTLCADVLQVLSMKPDAKYALRWEGTKHTAIAMFDDAAGRAYISSLQSRDVEAGFLLDAEIRYSRSEDPDDALEILLARVEPQNILRNLRIARRVSQLAHESATLRYNFAERLRVLSAVEDAGTLLTALEEFELAYLAYHLGNYQDGRRRFAILRQGGRYRVNEETVYLRKQGTGEIVRFDGRVTQSGSDSTMAIRSSGSSTVLFDARFLPRHFSDQQIQRYQTFPVVVRFRGSGPFAVPVRFASADDVAVERESVARAR